MCPWEHATRSGHQGRGCEGRVPFPASVLRGLQHQAALPVVKPLAGGQPLTGQEEMETRGVAHCVLKRRNSTGKETISRRESFSVEKRSRRQGGPSCLSRTNKPTGEAPATHYPAGVQWESEQGVGCRGRVLRFDTMGRSLSCLAF